MVGKYRFNVNKAFEGLHRAVGNLRELVIEEYGFSRCLRDEPCYGCLTFTWEDNSLESRVARMLTGLSI